MNLFFYYFLLTFLNNRRKKKKKNDFKKETFWISDAYFIFLFSFMRTVEWEEYANEERKRNRKTKVRVWDFDASLWAHIRLSFGFNNRLTAANFRIFFAFGCWKNKEKKRKKKNRHRENHQELSFLSIRTHNIRSQSQIISSNNGNNKPFSVNSVSTAGETEKTYAFGFVCWSISI